MIGGQQRRQAVIFTNGAGESVQKTTNGIHEMKDPYSILGAPEEADQDLIDSIYMASIKAFHPETFKGDPAFARARLDELTAAYNQICRTLPPNDSDTLIGNSLDAISAEHWSRLCQFFPCLHDLDAELTSLCVQLSEKFRRRLVTLKNFSHAREIQQSIKHDFGVELFGDDERLRAIGMTAIKQDRHGFAIAIMEANDLLGVGYFERKISRLAMEHPRDALPVLKECGFEDVLSTPHDWFRPGLYSLGNVARLRLLVDNGVAVFNERGRDLNPYLRFRSVAHLLVYYGQTLDRLRAIEVTGDP